MLNISVGARIVVTGCAIWVFGSNGVLYSQEAAERNDGGRLRGSEVTLRPESARQRDAEITAAKPDAPPRFRASGTVSAFSTSNADLTRDRHRSDTYLTAEIGVGYKRKFGDDWTFDVRAKQRLFRYNRLHDLDYESLTATAELGWQSERLSDVKWFGKYNFERLTDHFREEFLRTPVSTGTDYARTLGHTNLWFAIAADTGAMPTK